MEYRTDEKTGNRLSALGYGCMRLPFTVTGIDMKKSEKLLMRAIEGGVNYLDTAYLYPGSEAAVGSILAANGARDSVYLATKLPIANCRKAEDFDRFFAIQLERLRTPHIDYYLMHNINTLDQWQALCALGIEDWIARQRDSGAVRQVGFSFHGTRDEFLAVLDAYDWDFCQLQYNYSDENAQAGVTGLKRAAARGMPVIIMEPLLGGKLATGLPKRATDVFAQLEPERSPAAWALRWLWDQPEVTVVLSGMGQEAQLEDNLRATDGAVPGALTDAERAAYPRAMEIFRATDKVPCTGCGYCLPCPQGVNIPGCFSAYNASYSMGRVTGWQQYITGTAANRQGHASASRCVQCGQCKPRCPQSIAIPERLKEVEGRMEPFYFKWLMGALRR
ncbi:aldo/keto reductase [Eubacteriales bacterium OttesenSCG-928-A19]|nr:aldo/keto reductase [Eubacteriales bacterium OttesenSCG-928-A19]